MKRKLTIWMLLFAAAVVGLGMTAQDAEAVLVNFDDVASGTNINTQYLGLGVTFGCFDGSASPDVCAGNNAYANSATGAASAPNVISLTDGSTLGVVTDERFGFFRATFTNTVNSVSIDALAVLPPEYMGSTTNKPFLQAFNSSGGFLGTVDYTASVYSGTWQTLTFTSATDNIKFVAFSSYNGTGHPVYGMFDNLNFSSLAGWEGSGGGNNGGGTPVPEPATLLLIGSGIAGLGFAKRLSKR